MTNIKETFHERFAEYPIEKYLPHRSFPLQEVRDWCWDNHVECTRMGPFWFFRSEEDAIMFMLRWA